MRQNSFPFLLGVAFLCGCGDSPSVRVSANTFDFGDRLVGDVVTQTAATIENHSDQTIDLSPAITGDASFSIASGSCAGPLAPGTSCNLQVQYAPVAASVPKVQTAQVNLNLMNVTSNVNQAISLSGRSGVVTGTVTPSANPTVALYTLTLPYPGSWTVSFGKDTGYGLTTNSITSPAENSTTSVLVAGMQSQSQYHMQASIHFTNGRTATDTDRTFGTGALPPGIPAQFPVTLGAAGTPQPGIELINSFTGTEPSTIFATDLQGNTIWTYPFTDRTAGTFLYPGKLLPNGHFLVFISPPSFPLGLPGSNILREIDLAGNTIRELTMANLNAALAKTNLAVTLVNYSHDFVLLANGHLLIIANTAKSFTDLVGFPGVTNVVGDVVVDLDPNWNPVWLWNEFDHFDVNRHPWTVQFPDWTHTNSIAFSTDDGNFIVSMRHQNWIVKVNYSNGSGNGSVLWKLGEGGDFTLKGGTDPTDWFYAQHDAEFSSRNTTGVFSLTIMDNGDDRIFPAGVTCGAGTAPACLYTTIQELQIDETTKTATFQIHHILPPALYNDFGGNVEFLANGNLEYFLSGVVGGSNIFEVTSGSNPQTVWQMATPGANGYRGFRMPSLYFGVQW